MSVCIIYHSETGNTRSVAEHVAANQERDTLEKGGAMYPYEAFLQGPEKEGGSVSTA